MSRAMGDVDEIQSFIVNGIDQIIGEGILWLATVVLVMLMDWRVASDFAGAAAHGLLPAARTSTRRIKPIYTAARERLGDVTTRLQENLSGVVVIKIFGREKQEAERFRRRHRAVLQAADPGDQRAQHFLPLHARRRLFQQCLHDRHRRISDPHRSARPFTLGTLLAFRAYWWRLFGPVQTLARVNDMVQRAVAAGRRVFEVLDAPDELARCAGCR